VISDAMKPVVRLHQLFFLARENNSQEVFFSYRGKILTRFNGMWLVIDPQTKTLYAGVDLDNAIDTLQGVTYE